MINMERLTQMDGGSRVWIFQSSKELTGQLASEIKNALNSFLEQWAAHGQPLFSGFEIRHERFIVVSVDEAQAGATGCSIDSMMKVIQEVDASHGLNLLDRMKIAYRLDGNIVEESVHGFTEHLKEGRINADTIVFNNVISTLGDLESKWEVPAGDSWVASLIPAS